MASSSCFAFVTQAGMSVRDPGSLLSTATTSPTWASRIAWIISMSGPGQKEPLASISLSAVTDIIDLPSLCENRGSSSSDEQDLAVVGEFNEPADADDVLDHRIEVFLADYHEICGHCACVHVHVAYFRCLPEDLVPGRNVFLLHQCTQSLGLGAVLCGQRSWVSEFACAEGRQAPERQEDVGFDTHRRSPRRYRCGGLQPVGCAGENHERHFLRHGPGLLARCVSTLVRAAVCHLRTKVLTS